MKPRMLSWSNTGDCLFVVDALCAGQIIAGSSDTVPGLLANTTEQGFEQLNAIKGRSEKPYIVLIDSAAKSNHFVRTLDQRIQRLMNACWPGPLTLIMRAKEGAPFYLQSSDKAIAIRVPDHDGLRRVARNFNGLFSTSANSAGCPVPVDVHEIDDSILEHVIGVVDDESANTNNGKKLLPSTILDCTGERIKVVRVGAYPIAQLEEIAGEQFAS